MRYFIALLFIVSSVSAQDSRRNFWVNNNNNLQKSSFRFSATTPASALAGWIDVVGDPKNGNPIGTDARTGFSCYSTGRPNWDSAFGNTNSNDNLGQTTGTFSTFPAAAIKAGWYNYFGASTSSYQVVVGGLSASNTYKIVIMGSVATGLISAPVISEYNYLGAATGTATTLNVLGNTSTAVTFTGIVPAVDGTIKLSVLRQTGGGGGNFGVINALSIVEEPPATALPTVPLNLSVTPGNDTLSIDWDPPANYFTQPIVGYNLYRGRNTTPTLYKTLGNLSYYVDTGTNGTVYNYKVSARNTLGEGPLTSQVSGTPTAGGSYSYLFDSSNTSVSTSYPSAKAWVYRPPAYQDPANSTRKFPFLLFLGGNGSAGTNMANCINEGGSLSQYMFNGTTRPDSLLVMCPQLPIGASANGNNIMLEWRRWAINNLRVDTTRCYISGLSGGAQTGLWAVKSFDSLNFSGYIFMNGDGSGGTFNPTGKAANIMYGCAETDGTVRPFIVSASGNSTPTYWNAQINDPGNSQRSNIGEQFFMTPNVGHSASSWGTKMYNKQTAYVKMEPWLLQFSNDSVYTADAWMDSTEALVTGGKYVEAYLRTFDNQKLINLVATGAAKTALQARLTAALLSINTWGKFYVVKTGPTFTATGINNITSNTTGASISSIVDKGNSSSSYGFTVVSGAAAAPTTRTYSASTRYFYNYNYLGFAANMLQGQFIVRGNTQSYKFTGLNPLKTYQLLVFANADTIVTSGQKPNTLSIGTGTTTHYLYAGFNTHDFILITGLTPNGSNEVVFTASSHPATTYNGTIAGTRIRGAEFSINTASISGYLANSDSYMAAVCLIEVQ